MTREKSFKCSLPSITEPLSDWIFQYIFRDFDGGDVEHQQLRLLNVLKAMQFYNLERRRDECDDLYGLFSDPYFLEGNSEGTTYWLAMALAIKDLYSLDDQQLRRVIMGKN